MQHLRKSCPTIFANSNTVKGDNGYSVFRDVDGNKYYDADGKEITGDEFSKKCPNIYSNVTSSSKNVVTGDNGYSAEKTKDGTNYYDADGKAITPKEFKEHCPNIYKNLNTVKGDNGYSAFKDVDGIKYYDPEGNEISGEDFKKKCPNIYENMNKSQEENEDQGSTGSTYTVKDGDCLWNIAKDNLANKNKDVQGYEPSAAEISTETNRLMQLNNLSWESDNYHVLINPGDTIKLDEEDEAEEPKTQTPEPAEPAEPAAGEEPAAEIPESPIGEHPEENETPAEGG